MKRLWKVSATASGLRQEAQVRLDTSTTTTTLPLVQKASAQNMSHIWLQFCKCQHFDCYLFFLSRLGDENDFQLGEPGCLELVIECKMYAGQKKCNFMSPN